SPPSNYASLRKSYPGFKWSFYSNPLGFSGAIRAGLHKVRFPWVYLLNSDIALARDALESLAPYRSVTFFSIASQIALKDVTRFRDETNLTILFLENDLATIHDRIPEFPGTAENFYAGGGASLFQTDLLRSFVNDSLVYDPFYWEDVEWGWRARKLGYRSLFCPESMAHHRQHSTISRHFSADEVDAVFQRNRFLFQLRNFTTVGSTERVLKAIAQAPSNLSDYFLKPRSLYHIARGRFWNHLVPVDDAAVLETGPHEEHEASV
ncbi:MAG TPA: hypothetical protein VH640_18965, partial [Bryobacteraceae bacterium]